MKGRYLHYLSTVYPHRPADWVVFLQGDAPDHWEIDRLPVLVDVRAQSADTSREKKSRNSAWSTSPLPSSSITLNA